MKTGLSSARPYDPLVPVLDALLEGFDPGEMRDAAGRWVRGATSPRHGTFRIGDRVTYETGSREAGGHGPVTFTRQPGVHEVVGFQRNGNLRLREPQHLTTVDVHHSHAQLVPSMADMRTAQARVETARRRSVDPNAPAAEPYKPPSEASLRALARDGVYFGATPEPKRGVRAATARAGQGAGPPVFSSGRLITAPQRKRLASVIADIHANAWRDRSYMNSLISGALRDSGHVMGMSPGWMDRLHTNHASQLIKDLERLAKHGPGEMAREAAAPAVLGSLLEGHGR